MKCEICKNNVQETFLGKVIGTHVKDQKGKRRLVCKACQVAYHNKKDELLEQL